MIYIFSFLISFILVSFYFYWDASRKHVNSLKEYAKRERVPLIELFFVYIVAIALMSAVAYIFLVIVFTISIKVTIASILIITFIIGGLTSIDNLLKDK